MKCPACGVADLARDTREISANGVPVVVVGDFCTNCGEAVFDRENADRYGAALKSGRALAASNPAPTEHKDVR